MRDSFFFAAALLLGLNPVADAAIVEPVLERNAALLKKIASLHPNEAVILGKARLVGEFNETARRHNLHTTGPRARDFSMKMVWAPERQRALFLGANHNSPHRLNDVWEFNLGAMTWVMLYAPDNSRGFNDLGKDASDVEFRDGILYTRRGGPAVIGHSWWGLTYDPKNRQLLFMNTWGTNKKKAVEQLGGDPAELYDGPPLWAFSPDSRQWRAIKSPPPWPKAPFAAMLEYVPELGGAIWHANNWKMHATWLYDISGNAWRDIAVKGGGEDFKRASPKPEQVAYYDPTRQIVVAHRFFDTHHFDVRTRRWRKVLSGKEASAPFGHDTSGTIAFDPHSGHGLLFDRKDDTLWAYDPDRLTWSRLNPAGAPIPKGKKRLSYFDPTHNVFVVIKDTEVWVYRYRPLRPRIDP